MSTYYQSHAYTASEYRFTGQQDDAIAGLTYLRARYYDQSTGRFLGKDPMRGVVTVPGTQNAYVYALDSPVSVSDPTGLEAGGLADRLRDLLIDCSNQNNWFTRFVCRQGTAQTNLGFSIQLSDGDFSGAEEASGISNEFSANSGSGSGSSQGARTGRGRNRLQPDSSAVGDHSVFRRDASTGEVTHYETYELKVNPHPNDPSPWNTVKRYDAIGEPHFNKATQTDVLAPHVHDPTVPGGVRAPYPGEVP